jgi:hypothetical protein
MARFNPGSNNFELTPIKNISEECRVTLVRGSEALNSSQEMKERKKKSKWNWQFPLILFRRPLSCALGNPRQHGNREVYTRCGIYRRGLFVLPLVPRTGLPMSSAN